MRISPSTYRRVVLAATVMLGVIIVSGAAVRLTNSGLGCENWPTCTEESFVPEASFHGWIEFGNRLFTGVVSVAVILAVLGAIRREPSDRRLVMLAVGLVGGVLAQIVIGAVVVVFHLAPISVTAHFLVSMVLLANALWLYDAAGGIRHNTGEHPFDHRLLRTAHLAGAGLLLLTGTIVTGTGPNGGDSRASRLPYDLETVARVHSLSAWLFLAFTLGLVWLAMRTGRGVSPALRSLITAIVVQGGIGYLQYALGVPPVLVALHILGAIAVWVASVWVFLESDGAALPESVGPPRSLVTAR